MPAPPTMIEQFKAARRVSVPLIAVSTPDQPATVEKLTAAATNGTEPASIVWDMVRGPNAVNNPAKSVLAGLGNPIELQNPVSMLEAAHGLPDNALLFIMNAHRQDDPGTDQAIGNLRDEFKRNRRTLVLLAPAHTLATQLQPDVLQLDEPLPTREELAETVTKLHEAAEIAQPDASGMEKATDALAGLPSFAAEQAAALCLKRTGLDLPNLWERKRQMVEGVPGLSVWRGSESFEELAGLHNVKTFLSRLLTGKYRPHAVLFLDEVEKMVAGQGDSSGTSQAMQEAFLAWTQNTRAAGVILLGIPGAGKSATAKAAAGTAGIPCLQLSLSAVKGSLVGESERNIRTALKTVDAVAQGSVLMLATCNSIDALTPELRARFRLGTFFYDYPDEIERTHLWDLYTTKYGLNDPPSLNAAIPASPNWVGREIESCCEIADRLSISLHEAADYIVPVSVSDAQRMDVLRHSANGRYISASLPGLYRMPSASTQTVTQGQQRRAFENLPE